jgi:archaellum biogenesis protein FlaJ (TadC family)
MKYVTILAEEVSTVNFNQVLETSENTLRYSVDKNQVLLKFKGETPSFLVGKQTYTYPEIMEILDSSAWSEEPELL